MAEDLVTRLRGFWGDVTNRDILEAADEIERLRAALDECNARSGCQVLNLSEGNLCSVLADIHQISGAALAAARAALAEKGEK